MSNITEYAEAELKRIGMGADTEDEMNKAMHDHIIKMVETFADEGHSGFSASYAISILTKLLNWEPITPLTGEDDEWMEIDEQTAGRTGMFQNKRCGRVFKEDGKAYDIEGKVFRNPQGHTYTNFNSRTPVTFPYTPTTEIVEVADDEAN